MAKILQFAIFKLILLPITQVLRSDYLNVFAQRLLTRVFDRMDGILMRAALKRQIISFIRNSSFVRDLHLIYRYTHDLHSACPWVRYQCNIASKR